MKYFLTRKLGGEIVSYSDGFIKYDKKKFDLIEYNLTQQESEYLNEKKLICFKDNKLYFETPPRIQKRIDTKTLKEKISKATTIDDIKNLIFDLLKV